MIAVDTSALVAIAQHEQGHAAYRKLIETSRCIVGAATLVETHMVLRGRRAIDPVAFIDMLQTKLNLGLILLDFTHFHAARMAFDRYGKGRGRPAQLNFSDCLSYAVAKVSGAPLLFAGDDFRLTDIEPALTS